MKTLNVKAYSFDELTESIQQKIISNWRNNDSYFWNDENAESLNCFADIFSIKIREYDYGHRNYISASFTLDSEVLSLSGIRLAAYIWNNYKKHIFKGRYYYKNGKSKNSKIQLESECPLTGYYVDNALLHPIIDFLDKPEQLDFEQLLQQCLESWVDCCRKDFECWLSEESIVDDIKGGDYLFLADGRLADNLVFEYAA